MKPAYSRALVPRQFEVIVRALSWEREHRPATVREFLHALLASDLRRDTNSLEARTSTSDVPSRPVLSRPIPSIPTRDAPTVAAAKPEVKSQPAARPDPARVLEPNIAARSSEPAKREPTVKPTIKHEDILRLRAAIAAAEEHAENIEAPEPRDESQRHTDPMAKFRGYVAGPMASREEDSSDGIAPPALTPDSAHSPETPVKTSKRIWPWQRSAWLLAIAVTSALAMVATQLDFGSEPIAQAQARPSAPTRLSPIAKPQTLAVAAPQIAEPAVSVEEKKSPQIAVKPSTSSMPPAASGEISFATRTLQVGVGQTIAALSVKRLNSTRGRARVAWTIEGGTARAGVDYQLGTAHTIEFLEGQSVRSLFIPLVPEKELGDARTSRTFTVRLQSTSGGPKLGEIKQVHVTIVGDVGVEHLARSDTT
jgi:hypothetical protein